MEVDLFRIKNDRYGRYAQNYNQSFLLKTKETFLIKEKRSMFFM